MLDFGDTRHLPRVLLIDDDMISREVLATVLTLSGYTVHTAEDGPASLRLLAAGDSRPDVILMDSQMPGLSGVPLIRELRAHTPASIFAVSGSDVPESVIAAADGFLLKPFGPDTLQKMLEKHGPLPPAGPPTPEPEQPVIDPGTLARLRELMPESSVREIYAAIVADLARRIHSLELAIAARDPAAIRTLGHAIKGGCAMAGALQAAALGAHLESISDDLGNSAKLLDDLRSAALKLERMLNTDFSA